MINDPKDVPGGEERLLAELKARAAVDPGFRKRLLDAPHEAIAEVTGAAPPRDLGIQFIEKPAGVEVLVLLPDRLQQEELTPEELERVAGGDCVFTCYFSCDEGTCGDYQLTCAIGLTCFNGHSVQDC